MSGLSAGLVRCFDRLNAAAAWLARTLPLLPAALLYLRQF